MKCYKLFLAMVLVLVFIPLHLYAQTAEDQGVNVIYLLDVSKSMRKGDLFENIKGKLKDLMRERGLHDRIVLITFGEEVDTVLDRQIFSSKDIEDINRQIGKLRADSDWTWMSRAFEKTKEKARNIKSQSPSKNLIIYLLTDCENDPPPDIGEPKWKFIEVLQKFFKDFHIQDTSIFLLAYRPLDEEEKEGITKTPIEVKEPGSANPLPRIVLAASGFQWGLVSPSRGGTTQKGEIRITKMEGITRDKVQITSSPKFKISPQSFECREIGQSVPLDLVVPADLAPGKYTEVIKFSAVKAMVEPNRIDATFEVASSPKKEIEIKDPPKGSEKIPLWLLLLALLALIGGAVFLFRKFALSGPSRTVWIETEDKMLHPANVTGKKLFLGRPASSPNLDLGLPRYYLTLDKERGVLLGDTATRTENAVEFDKAMFCVGSDGKPVKLMFFDQEPRSDDLIKSQQTKDLPKEFQDI